MTTDVHLLSLAERNCLHGAKLSEVRVFTAGPPGLVPEPYVLKVTAAARGGKPAVAKYKLAASREETKPGLYRAVLWPHGQVTMADCWGDRKVRRIAATYACFMDIPGDYEFPF